METLQANKIEFDRADYMSKKCSHHEYYSQFVTQGMKDIILSKYTPEQLKACYEQDRNLNNIPLKWWDSYEGFFKQHIARTNKRLNGQNTWSSCEHTCSMKAAALQIINKD